ncbi:MAG: carboxypeptidase regulatory-like domain-containing protein [Verrucomicrobiaceae bacterium]|nr:MAG: carboxypeptidase regulatory-like domain-containing protein [Verrucomicrobiaceae bacterium]
MARIDSTEALLYGKVVDEQGAPVPEALVVCLPNPDPWISGSRRTELKADAEGAFMIREKNSPTLHISTSAPGYYTGEKSSDIFSFADLPESLPASIRKEMPPPDRTTLSAPAVFILRRMGNREPLMARSKSGVMTETQEYQIGSGKSHRVDVRYHVDPEVVRESEREGVVPAWRVDISVPGGGVLLARKVDFADLSSFTAPESGYEPVIRITNGGETENAVFKRDLEPEFFVRFSDGTFARLETRFSYSAKRPFAVVRSWFNPSGSRATEFDPTLQIDLPEEE